MKSKYYSIARSVAKRTPLSTPQVLSEISKVINVLIGFGYSSEKVDESITVEHIENIVMKKVKIGFY